ncbi:MAG: bis(5'-nucleosyl)-tetraphosphatase (symmetrical) YqeK [Acholeplasmataceae bacterium]
MIERLLRDVRKKLADHPERLRHTLGVYETALELALIHGADRRAVAIASLMHDYHRHDPIAELTSGLDPDTVERYRKIPAIYHAIRASQTLRTVYGVTDSDTLNAVRYHVFGRPKMSLTERVVFVSDLAEPGRAFIDTKALFDLAVRDIDLACEKAMRIIMDYAITEGKEPDIEQLDAYRYYEEVNRGKTR